MSTSNWIYGCVASSGPIRSGGFQQLVITGVAGVDGSFAREILFFCASRRGRSRGQSILINTPHFYCTTYARLVRQRQLGPSFWRWNQTSKNFLKRKQNYRKSEFLFRFEITRIYCTTYGRLLGAAPIGLPHFGGGWLPSESFWTDPHLDWLLARWRNSLILVNEAQLPFLWQTTVDKWCTVNEWMTKVSVSGRCTTVT